MSAGPTVFVVDPDAAVGEAVARLAGSMGLACRAHTSGLEFLDTYDLRQPGCLVLEVRIADVSGPQIQRRLLAAGATTPVIFHAAHATPPVIVRTMREGAVHFLEKTCDEQELWESIQHALQLDEQRRRDFRQREELEARMASLTPDEREILHLVVRGKQNKEIARLQDVSVRTVELRRARVMDKLQVHSLAELLRNVLLFENGRDTLLYEPYAEHGRGRR
jgi:two-component system response regulator DctR